MQSTYKDLLSLSHVDYPESTMKTIEDLETGYKYTRSSLGLWGLEKLFLKGSYKVRTTDFDIIKHEEV